MKVLAPPLSPILRSSSQGRLLAALMLDPSREWVVSELAAHAGVDPATALREIRRAETAGIVTSRKIGPARLVTANTSARHYDALAEVVLAAFGPPAVICEEFAAVDGAAAVILFGSWAARHAGHEGPAPGDIDVLVIGTPDRSVVYEAAERSESRLGVEVNPTVRSTSEWASDDPFLVELRRRPHEVLSVDTAIAELVNLDTDGVLP